TFGGMYLWPFLEARFTGDRSPHNLLDRARDAPLRSAVGTSVFAFYTVLFMAGSNDILAPLLQVAPESITTAFRVLVFVLPAAVFWLTRRLCRELRDRAGRPPEPPVHQVVRTPAGGYDVVEEEGSLET
ncbi:MAG: ubiquinol-cytochrome c reductase cytochrome b subunit, partial [Acidimicrobiia bacterium]